MLTATNLALRVAGNVLVEGASFTVGQGRKIGLIGANGAGKTSLFRLIVGELDADAGEIDFPAGTRIACLAQEVAASEAPALDYVLSGDAALVEINAALASAESGGRYGEVAELHDRLAAIDGYSATSRAEQLLVGLGFSESDFRRTLASFSGGWRIRLNLARTLMAPSDLLLLDEPTNHLDLDAILWLSDWIGRYPGTLLLISHDREFLDETVDGIAYLHHKTIELFSGNYSQFERVKAARLAEQQSNYDRQQREIRHMQDFVRRFRAKATKARQAQSRIKALERMERIAPAHVDSPFRFEIPHADKLSNPLLVVDRASMGYGHSVLTDVRLTLQPGDRIGLLGHNGAGKSTLVRSLTGELPLLSGDRTLGINTRIGYFSQHQVDDLDLTGSALLHIQRIDASAGEQEARDFLGGFDFHGDKVLEPVKTFSGGEKARLALALVAWARPNLLLMDEPTNHLDMDMRQALTVALQDFDGALVLISHDRHLLASAVDDFLLVDDGRVEPFRGDLSDYRKRLFAGNTAPVPEAPAAPPAPKQNHREAGQLRTRLATIEKRLSRLQRKLGEVESALSESSLYEGAEQHQLHRLLREQAGLNEEIAELEEDWLEKSETLEGLARREAPG